MVTQESSFSCAHKCIALLVHLFTASAAVLGLFALQQITLGNITGALWFMAAAVGIDAIDGTIARKVRIKDVIPKIDGALLDNIVDYFNYVIVPAFVFLTSEQFLPNSVKGILTTLIVISSAYQFTQNDAKTRDNFFKGFPSYWNMAFFHIVYFEFHPWTNAVILSCLVVLVFIPIKYVYLSRLEFLARHRSLRMVVYLSTATYALAGFTLLLGAEQFREICNVYAVFYMCSYFLLSVYSTLFPFKKEN